MLEFPKERYPETGKHITDAIKEGHSEVCTIDVVVPQIEGNCR